MEVKRIEHKYLLSEEAATKLQRRLRLLLRPDSHNGLSGYRVKSLYFDTYDDTDYLEKNAGVFHRKKLRLRLYDEESDVVKLERKEKHGEFQVKTGIQLTVQHAAAFSAGELEFLAENESREAKSLYIDAVVRRKPACIIEYGRSAFFWPEGNTRITIDRQIRYCGAEHDFFAKALPYRRLGEAGAAVLEVKYDVTLPAIVRELLSPFCASRLSYGKYERCRGMF